MIVECPGCNSRYDVTGRPVGTRLRCRCGTVIRVERPSEFAQALKCPSCGAASDPNSTKCEFCGTVLSTVACAHCFGRIFNGSKYCQHCGAEVLAPALPDSTGSFVRACPRCSPQKNDLTSHLLDNILLDECHKCGGVWIDHSAFKRILKEQDRQASILSLGGAAVELSTLDPSHGPKASEVRYLRCPDCFQIMNRKNFAKISGAITNVCPSHGIWFDRDELGQVIQFVQSGGLDRSRRQEAEELERRAHQAQQAEFGPIPIESASRNTTTGFFDLVVDALGQFLGVRR